MKKTIIPLIVFWIVLPFGYYSYAQNSNLFEEYISNFTKVQLTDSFQLFSTYNWNDFDKRIFNNKYDMFLLRDMQTKYTVNNYFWFVCKLDTFYLTLLLNCNEDIDDFKNNGVYYYFIIYDEFGKIINSYKWLAGTDKQWFSDGVNYTSKLYLNKNQIKYMLYGPYNNENETNCLEVIYNIKGKGSFEKYSQKEFKAKKVDQWNW